MRCHSSEESAGRDICSFETVRAELLPLTSTNTLSMHSQVHRLKATHSVCIAKSTGSKNLLFVCRDVCALKALVKQQVILLRLGPCRAPAQKSDVCFLQDDQRWALQSHADRACNDAARYKSRCVEHTKELQASGRRVLELQQDLKLAESQMASLQSSSMEAASETWQLKLSKNRAERELQASKVPSTRSSYYAGLSCCNAFPCPVHC